MNNLLSSLAILIPCCPVWRCNYEVYCWWVFSHVDTFPKFVCLRSHFELRNIDGSSQ